MKAQGYWLGGKMPFDFRAEEDGKHKRLVPEEFNAETVRLAASLLVDHGCSTHETAERLNGLGRPTAKGKRWNNMLLRHTMSRPIMVPLLLDEDRFKQVQEVLAQTSQVFRGRDQCYPLSLRIYGLCGARYHGVFRRDISTRFYSCNNKRWDNRDTRCDDAVIRADDIEVVVWEQVCDLLSRPERLVALAEGYLGLRGQQIEVERDEYEEATKKVAELDRAIKNLLVTSARAGLAPADI